MIQVTRIGTAPIIHAGLCDSLGDNINGPSLIARPDWAPGPGRYLLYFAHHMGQWIRLAFADRIEGPWRIHRPGTLPLAATPLAQNRPQVPQPDWAAAAGTDGLYPHLASPDVWLDNDSKTFRMIFHGLAADGDQVSYEAISPDGLSWTVQGPPINDSYLRRFSYDGSDYALARLGVLLRRNTASSTASSTASNTAQGTWQIGAQLLSGQVRHVAVLARGDVLHVLYTRIGDRPERLLHRRIRMSGDWTTWQTFGPETELLRPELDWEGAALPQTASEVGATAFEHALRDPALFEHGDDLYLVYAGGGEHALGLGQITGI